MKIKVRDFRWIAQGCQHTPSCPHPLPWLTSPHRAQPQSAMVGVRQPPPPPLPELWSFQCSLLPEVAFPGIKMSQGELVGLCRYSKITANYTYVNRCKRNTNKLLAFLFQVALQKIFAETITLGNQKPERKLLQEK